MERKGHGYPAPRAGLTGSVVSIHFMGSLFQPILGACISIRRLRQGVSAPALLLFGG